MLLYVLRTVPYRRPNAAGKLRLLINRHPRYTVTARKPFVHRRGRRKISGAGDVADLVFSRPYKELCAFAALPSLAERCSRLLIWCSRVISPCDMRGTVSRGCSGICLTATTCSVREKVLTHPRDIALEGSVSIVGKAT